MTGTLGDGNDAEVLDLAFNRNGVERPDQRLGKTDSLYAILLCRLLRNHVGINARGSVASPEWTRFWREEWAASSDGYGGG